MPAKCFGCGAAGYVQSECPYCADVTDTRPAWCGTCDRRTRLATVDLERGTVKKCPYCHPAPYKPLAQHQRCPNCKMTVYAWDGNECGKHLSPVAPDKRLSIERIHQIEAESGVKK